MVPCVAYRERLTDAVTLKNIVINAFEFVQEKKLRAKRTRTRTETQWSV